MLFITTEEGESQSNLYGVIREVTHLQGAAGNVVLGLNSGITVSGIVQEHIDPRSEPNLVSIEEQTASRRAAAGGARIIQPDLNPA